MQAKQFTGDRLCKFRGVPSCEGNIRKEVQKKKKKNARGTVALIQSVTYIEKFNDSCELQSGQSKVNAL